MVILGLDIYYRWEGDTFIFQKRLKNIQPPAFSQLALSNFCRFLSRYHRYLKYLGHARCYENIYRSFSTRPLSPGNKCLVPIQEQENVRCMSLGEGRIYVPAGKYFLQQTNFCYFITEKMQSATGSTSQQVHRICPPPVMCGISMNTSRQKTYYWSHVQQQLYQQYHV